MGQNFLAADREQGFLLPPDVRDWLPEGHFAWFVIEAVAEMDLARSMALYRQDGHGRAAFDPAVTVALLLYAYARGIRSSRAIERACEEDVAFRVLAAHQVPDHTRSRGSASATRTRWPASSARSWRCAPMPVWWARTCSRSTAPNSTRPHRSERPAITNGSRAVLAHADAIDAEEDERFGDERGDELPEPLGTRQGRAKWLADAKRRPEERRAREARPIPASRPAQRRLEEEHHVEVHANADYEAYRARGVDKTGRRFGGPPKPFEPPAKPVRKINTTGPDSRNVKRFAGRRRATTPKPSAPTARS